MVSFCIVYKIFFLLSNGIYILLVLTRVNGGGVDVKKVCHFVRSVVKVGRKPYLCTRYVIYSLKQGDDKSFFVR